MALSSIINLVKQTGGSNKFVRNREELLKSSYVNMTTLGAIGILRDTLSFRGEEKGSPKDPSLQTRRHNINRVLSLSGADGKTYTATVNLTVVLPGGNVIDVPTIKNLVGDVVACTTVLEFANNPDVPATNGSNIATYYVERVQVLDT